MEKLYVNKGGCGGDCTGCGDKNCGKPDCPTPVLETPEQIASMPPAPCPDNSHQEPPIKEPEKPCGPKYFCPAPEPGCPADHSPCTAPEKPPCGCSWIQQCEQSYPPDIPCPPNHTGWGQFDGGVVYWADVPKCMEKCTDVLSSLCWLPTYDYVQHDWHHILDLSTNTQLTTNLMVRRGNIPSKIDTQEFINLAVRIVRMGFMFDAVPEASFPSPKDLGLAVVQTGEDSEGKPVYGIAVTNCGNPVGTPLNLVTTWNGSGQAVSLEVPVANIPNLGQ